MRWLLAGLLPLVACVVRPGVGEERVYDDIEFDHGTADEMEADLVEDGPALRTNAENLEVEHLSTDFAPGLRVTEVGFITELSLGIPLTHVFITLRNFGDVTYCNVKLSSVFTDVRGEVVAETQYGVLDGPVMRQDRFVHVCLKPGEEGITQIVDRPDEVVDVRDVVHATFEVSSFGGRDPEAIDGPSLDQVYAIHKTVRATPRVDIDTLAGALTVGAERVKRLSMTAFVRDEGGFYRDRAHMLFEEARAFAPHEQFDFELRGMTLTRTDASEVRSVRVTFSYELDPDSP